MIGVILTVITAIAASGLAALLAAGGMSEPVRVPTRERDESDGPPSPGAETEG